MTKRMIGMGLLFLLTSSGSAAEQRQDKIVFDSDHEGVTQIYSVNLDGSELTNLSNTERRSADQPACSPDGKRIALSFFLDIFIIDLDGLNAVNLTSDRDTNQFPSWSPDGTKIVFWNSPNPANEDHHSGLHIINTDGSGLHHIPNAGLATESTWSPQGDRIAYASTNGEIFVIDIDGNNNKNLTSQLEFSMSPVWSPDGRQIAFWTIIENRSDIMIMDADGMNLTNLTNTALVNEQSPAWSPDGTQIAFGLGKGGGQDDLYTMNADGTNPTLILEDLGRIGRISWCSSEYPTLIREWPWGAIKGKRRR